MAAEKLIYVLDASAIVAYLRKEPGAQVVNDVIVDARNQCYAHALNLCEVYYEAIKRGGLIMAEQSMKDLFALGVVERNDFDGQFWREVGQLKGGL